MPNRGYLAAIRVGLVEYLRTRTGIQWDYYNSLVLPNEGAKGRIFIFSTHSPGGINYTRITHEAQLEILLAHPDHQEVQGLLCDWGEYLIETMRELKEQGFSGLYRGVQLTNACAGIKLGEGIKYYVQDADQRQDIPEGIAVGTLQANYEFIYESSVELGY